MKTLFIFLLLLLFSIFLGIQIVHDPGYALFAYRDWTIEMPLWLTILVFFLLSGVIHYFFLLLGGVSKLGSWLNARREKWLRTYSHKQTMQGLIELAEGDWHKAQRSLLAGAKYSDTAVLNFIAAARAANELGEYEQRDAYLRQAHKVTKRAGVAVSIVQADLQLSQKQYEQAFATLKHLRQLLPHHTYVLRLLRRLFLQTKDWQGLREILPELRRCKSIKPQEVDDLEAKTFMALLENAIALSNVDSVKMLWQETPKRLQQQEIFILPYIRFLMRHQEMVAAEKIMTQALRRHWQPKLLREYATFSNHPERQLDYAESWIKDHETDSDLLFSLGKLCTLNQLWSKAKDYYSKSLSMRQDAEAYLALAELFEQEGEKGKSLDLYRKGLLLSLTKQE